MFYYFYRLLLSSCVCQLLIKFMMMMMTRLCKAKDKMICVRENWFFFGLIVSDVITCQLIWYCVMFCHFSPLCTQCAKFVRQQVYKCCTVTVKSYCSRSVVCHKFCTVRWLSSCQSVTLPLMQINCYSSLPLKMQSSFHGRQLSTARVSGTVFGRLLKLRYILLTGAVGGGITAHQVTLVLLSV